MAAPRARKAQDECTDHEYVLNNGVVRCILCGAPAEAE